MVRIDVGGGNSSELKDVRVFGVAVAGEDQEVFPLETEEGEPLVGVHLGGSSLVRHRGRVVHGEIGGAAR
jgi:hypothetical protein